jgi:methylated-DNA-[protein]-cysteine S-methyltransferase
MDFPLYTFLPSAFDRLSIVWRETEKGPKVQRVFLPQGRMSAEDLVRTTFAHARPRSHPRIRELGVVIQGFLEGQDVECGLDIIALEKCSDFQRGVLLAEYEIPRSWVSTYGRIARILGTPNGARAVGNALSRNPFPIVIPCHRAIRSNGERGGFQGGLRMKRALLELEGVGFSAEGKVLTGRIHY